MKKRDSLIRELKAENQHLKTEVQAARPSLRKQLEESKIQTEYERLQRLVAKIPPELFEMVNPHKEQVK